MINIAIIGGGPNGMYFLNGIYSLLKNRNDQPVSISLFDNYGNFGSGWAHSPNQAKTSMLNRIVGQLSFAPDGTNTEHTLLPACPRITFSDWLQRKYRETHDQRYKNQQTNSRRVSYMANRCVRFSASWFLTCRMPA